MIYKTVNGRCPDNLRGRLIPSSQLSNYSTRIQLDLDIPIISLEVSIAGLFLSLRLFKSRIVDCKICMHMVSVGLHCCLPIAIFMIGSGELNSMVVLVHGERPS